MGLDFMRDYVTNVVIFHTNFSLNNFFFNLPPSGYVVRNITGLKKNE